MVKIENIWTLMWDYFEIHIVMIVEAKRRFFLARRWSGAGALLMIIPCYDERNITIIPRLVRGSLNTQWGEMTNEAKMPNCYAPTDLYWAKR